MSGMASQKKASNPAVEPMPLPHIVWIGEAGAFGPSQVGKKESRS
jgi:hypothetical protein